MGGSINVTIRKEDETVYNMSKWTNDLPWFCQNVKFYEINNKHIQNYIDKTQPNEFTSLNPDGYGLVVFDFNTKTILSNQNYINFDVISISSLRIETFDSENTLPLYDEYSTTNNVKKLLDKKIIKTYNSCSSLDNNITINKISSWNEVVTLINGDISQWIEFNLTPPNWTLLEFDDDHDGFNKMKNKIIELGFKLNNEEIKLWDEFLD